MTAIAATSRPTAAGGPRRVLLVFSQRRDARDVTGWLSSALDLDLTVARDGRVAQTLLRAAGPGRYRAVLTDAELRGGSGLELLSLAKSLDPDVTTLLISRLPTEVLDMEEMFFVDHHVRAGLEGERLCDEVCRALGMSPGVARAGVAALPTTGLPNAHVSFPFGRSVECEALATPVPAPLGPVSWGGSPGEGLAPTAGTRRRWA